MKITKTQLEQIINEEIDAMTEGEDEQTSSIDEGLENITPENIEILMKAVKHFGTQPAVMSALATGGLVAAVAAIKDMVERNKQYEDKCCHLRTDY